ncbi:hypothetical protein O5D80_001667 [Batrachochytrium dendrobatidis]|nr:hypothetical protein O5D80_001667 [Batrachochytrium dendrobatidis]
MEDEVKENEAAQVNTPEQIISKTPENSKVYPLEEQAISNADIQSVLEFSDTNAETISTPTLVASEEPPPMLPEDRPDGPLPQVDASQYIASSITQSRPCSHTSQIDINDELDHSLLPSTEIQESNEYNEDDASIIHASTMQANLAEENEKDNALLESILHSIQAHIQEETIEADEKNMGVLDVQDIQFANMFEPVEPQDTKILNDFANIIYSDDRIHPLSKTTQLMTSPLPVDVDNTFPFVHADYEADQDELMFGLTTNMTRSASVDEMVDDTMLGVHNTVQIALLRPVSPTLTCTDHQTNEHVIDNQHEHLGSSWQSNDIKHDANSSMRIGTQDMMDNDNQDGQEYRNSTIDRQPSESLIEIEIDRDAIVLSIKKNLELRDKLSLRNSMLQYKLSEYFKKKRTDDTRDGEKSVSDQEQRYANCMSSLNELRTEYNSINIANQKFIGEYKGKLEERLDEVTTKADEFWKYKRSIALDAENSRTGKPLPTKIVDQLESTERKKENEVVAVRLDNIKLRNKLRRHEQLLRQKEELADGLHLIDFEQLKIENQTYNEKIEERNEELLKLRKKITNVVQVLTHVKEKLQFVQGETVDLKLDLKALDKQVTLRRDSLPISKQNRDSLKNINTTLRQKNGLLGNDNLLRDYGEKVDESKNLKSKIDRLQEYYQELIAEIQLLRQKMQKAEFISRMSVTHMVKHT